MALFNTQELRLISEVTMPQWNEQSNIGRRPVWFVKKGNSYNVVKAEVMQKVTQNIDISNERLRDSWKIIYYFYQTLGFVPAMRLLEDSEMQNIANKITNGNQKNFCEVYLTAGQYDQSTVFYLMDFVDGLTDLEHLPPNRQLDARTAFLSSSGAKRLGQLIALDFFFDNRDRIEADGSAGMATVGDITNTGNLLFANGQIIGLDFFHCASRLLDLFSTNIPNANKSSGYGIWAGYALKQANRNNLAIAIAQSLAKTLGWTTQARYIKQGLDEGCDDIKNLISNCTNTGLWSIICPGKGLPQQMKYRKTVL